MNIKPGEMWEIGTGGARCIERAYPTPSEPHSVADLVAEVERLRQRVAELEAESETWEKTSVTALVAKRREQEARIAELEATVAELRAAWGGRGVVKR